MIFDHIEKLKKHYTDKYVVVDESRPELQRFKRPDRRREDGQYQRPGPRRVRRLQQHRLVRHRPGVSAGRPRPRAEAGRNQERQSRRSESRVAQSSSRGRKAGRREESAGTAAAKPPPANRSPNSGRCSQAGAPRRTAASRGSQAAAAAAGKVAPGGKGMSMADILAAARGNKPAAASCRTRCGSRGRASRCSKAGRRLQRQRAPAAAAPAQRCPRRQRHEHGRNPGDGPRQEARRRRRAQLSCRRASSRQSCSAAEEPIAEEPAAEEPAAPAASSGGGKIPEGPNQRRRRTSGILPQGRYKVGREAGVRLPSQTVAFVRRERNAPAPTATKGFTMSMPGQYEPPPPKSGGTSVLKIVLIVLAVLTVEAAAYARLSRDRQSGTERAFKASLEEGMQSMQLDAVDTQAMESADENAAVVERLGKPIAADEGEGIKWPYKRQGNGELNPDGETLQFDVKGPKGKAHRDRARQARFRRHVLRQPMITVMFDDASSIDVPPKAEPLTINPDRRRRSNGRAGSQSYFTSSIRSSATRLHRAVSSLTRSY